MTSVKASNLPLYERRNVPKRCTFLGGAPSRNRSAIQVADGYHESEPAHTTDNFPIRLMLTFGSTDEFARSEIANLSHLVVDAKPAELAIGPTLPGRRRYKPSRFATQNRRSSDRPHPGSGRGP
jgi:hypothetical protein